MRMGSFRFDDGADHRGDAVNLRYACDPLIGVHLDDAIVVGAIESEPLPARNSELSHFDASDLHCGSPDSAKVFSSSSSNADSPRLPRRCCSMSSPPRFWKPR